MKCFQGHGANKCHPPFLQEVIEQPVASVWPLLLITSKEIISVSKTVTVMLQNRRWAGSFGNKLERQHVVLRFLGHVDVVVTTQLCAVTAAMSSTWLDRQGCVQMKRYLQNQAAHSIWSTTQATVYSLLSKM